MISSFICPILITVNRPFGTWDAIFPDPAMTVAAIDQLVHHAMIIEMNTDSYRRKKPAKHEQYRPMPLLHPRMTLAILVDAQRQLNDHHHTRRRSSS